jgi:hypothetical protein
MEAATRVLLSTCLITLSIGGKMALIVLEAAFKDRR